MEVALGDRLVKVEGIKCLGKATMHEPKRLPWLAMVSLVKDRLGRLAKGRGTGGHLPHKRTIM